MQDDISSHEVRLNPHKVRFNHTSENAEKLKIPVWVRIDLDLCRSRYRLGDINKSWEVPMKVGPQNCYLSF